MRSRVRKKLRRSGPWLEELEPRRVLAGFQPTAQEQQFVELLNNARANPAAYGASIGVNLSSIPPAPPLALDPTLVESARLHSLDMSARNYFSHTTPEGLGPYDRMMAAGYPAGAAWGESIAGGTVYPTPADALRGLITDAGEADLGHRYHLLGYGPVNNLQSQVGIGIVLGGTGSYQDYYTIDTAGIPGGLAFLTGVVYFDANANGTYDPNEGLGGVTVTVAGAGFTATFDSGGYSIPLAAGTYIVSASGGALLAPITQTVTIGTTNVRLDFRADPLIVNQLKTWVGLLYQDLLHRAAASGEISAWIGALEQGVTKSAVVSAILGSGEYNAQVVTQMYQTYLHRIPDAAELTGYTTALEQGLSDTAARRLILGSDEYWNEHGANAASFVQGLYGDLLGRPYAPQEADGWIALVQGGNRAAVVNGLTGSPEYDANLVRNWYQSYLRRPASAPELTAWIIYFEASGAVRTFQDLLLSSGEYFTGSQGW
jgi:uncharacterized protein YkwD